MIHDALNQEACRVVSSLYEEIHIFSLSFEHLVLENVIWSAKSKYLQYLNPNISNKHRMCHPKMLLLIIFHSNTKE